MEENKQQKRYFEGEKESLDAYVVQPQKTKLKRREIKDMIVDCLTSVYKGKEFDVEKYHQTMQKLAESEEDMYIYENGYRYVYSFGDFNLNIICSQENGKTSVEFYFDNPIVPSVVFNEINSFVNTLCKSQPNQEKETLSFDCIIYSERDLSRIKGMNSLDYKLFTFTTEIENASEKIIDFAKEICSKQDKFDAETLLKITEMAMPKEEDVAEDDKTM